MDEEKICNCLDGGVRVPETCWKRHKSKDYIFLHRSYVQIFFSTSTKIFFSSSILKKQTQKLTKIENDQNVAKSATNYLFAAMFIPIKMLKSKLQIVIACRSVGCRRIVVCGIEVRVCRVCL